MTRRKHHVGTRDLGLDLILRFNATDVTILATGKLGNKRGKINIESMELQVNIFFWEDKFFVFF